MTESTLRQSICDVGARLWQRGLIGANEGNLSLRLDQDRFLCTPAGVSKGHLKPEAIVAIDHEGQPLTGGRPSSEFRLHLGLYRERPDCLAIVHAHPPIATGFTLAEVDLDASCLPEAAVVLGPIARLPFAMPGTDEVPNGLKAVAQSHKTFLLGHHGAVTLGATMDEAADRMETLERIAKILLTAHLLGGPKRIAHPRYERLLAEHLHGRLD